MFRRSNKEKNRTDEQPDNKIKPVQPPVSQAAKQQPEAGAQARAAVSDDTMSREELLQSEEAREMYEKIITLRQSLVSLKQHGEETLPQVSPVSDESLLPREEPGSGIQLEETAEIFAAEQAIIEQARRDAEEARQREEEAKRRELYEQQRLQQALEAEKRAALVEAEAARMRQQAIEAKRRAVEAERKKALEDMQAAHRSNAANQGAKAATAEERLAFFDERDEAHTADAEKLEAAKQALLFAQAQQGEILEKISTSSESETERLAERQTMQTERAKEQKTAMEKAQKLEKAQRKKAEKALRTEEKEKHRREKKEAAAAARLQKARAAAAELGGGVVNVNGVTINTEIKEVHGFSWRDFFGIADRREKNAKSKAEQKALKREREKRREEARAVADMMGKQTLASFESSRIGRRIHSMKLFCEHYKAGLLLAFAIILTAAVGTAGIFNYCTAYEYSYNGKALGIVKEKDEVLQITDLLQGALTEDKNVEVVIDAKDDITFKRVSAMGDVKIDTTEEVLKRLTYMGDLNVKAYGIYVDGKKIGAVESKETAAEVIEKIKDKYVSHKEGAKVEEAVFLEDVEVKRSNTGLQNISSKNEMVDILCTSGEKETLHKVVAGETLADIAKLYSMTEEDILKDNGSVDPKKLVVGSTLVIRQNAPMLTVKITELLTYEKIVEHEVEKKDSADIYEGYSETEQKGQDGISEVTARIVTVNGETIKENALVTTVLEEPTTEVILIGVKDRPPTVGSGKYIWPLEGGYSFSSKFGYRWGRLHAGIDLATPVGNDVLAADGGTVTKSGYSGAYGYLVVIDHQNGMETYYAHNSKLLVGVGDKVFQGQHIAESGNTGRSTGAHLHFEVHVDGTAKNPMNYLP